jgi:hypothetical protein
VLLSLLSAVLPWIDHLTYTFGSPTETVSFALHPSAFLRFQVAQARTVTLERVDASLSQC